MLDLVPAKFYSVGERLRAAAKKASAWVQLQSKRTAAFVNGHPPWLWEIRYFCLTVFVALVVPGTIFYLWPREDIIRYAGLFLQLAGISTVWLGIRETRTRTEHPTSFQQARKWWHRRPRYGGRGTTVAGSSAGASASVGRATGSVGPRPNATIDDRVTALEKKLADVTSRLYEFRDNIENKNHQLKQDIQDESEGRQKADQELGKKLKDAQTGGLYISAMGAIWLLVGVIMGTIPYELERWLIWFLNAAA